MNDSIELNKAPYSALTIAKYVVVYADEHRNTLHQFMTNLRLQKVLYFIQAQFVYMVGYPCFKDELIAWRFGPAVPEVYYYFSSFSASIIKPYCKDAIETKLVISQKDQEQINNIIEMLDEYPSHELVNITLDHALWRKAACTLSRVISLVNIYNFFKTDQ